MRNSCFYVICSSILTIHDFKDFSKIFQKNCYNLKTTDMADTTFLPKPFIYSTIIIILKPLNKNRIKTKSARQDSKIICNLTYRLNFPELSDGFQLLLKLLYISSLMPSVLPAKNYTSINHAEIF